MRSDAKASTAGSTQRQAQKPALLLCLLAVAVAALALVVGSASAAKVHSFKEVFGSAAQPSFSTPRDIAVDPTSGDVYVMAAGGTPSISRYNADGTADNFSALGTNVIDGKVGPDLTPQNGLGFASASESQVAVDDSGGATDGNIYVTQSSPNAINVFASTGAYLGQLTAAGVTNFSEACGVAVDSAGAVYVGDFGSGIKKFVPAANPPVNADHTATFTTTTNPCTLAAGAGATAGFLFPARFNGAISKIDSGTGELKYTVSSDAHTTVSVDPTTGHVFGATGSTVKEFDASGVGAATAVASAKPASSVQGLASNGDVYVSRSSFSNVEVYASALTVFPDVTTNAASPTGVKATLNGTVNPDGVELSECKFEWGKTTAYGNTVPCAETPAAIGSGTSPVAVHADISGLQPNGVQYNFRLVAKNPTTAAVNGSNLSFTTPDTVITTAASGITPTTATLNGTVNPDGVAMTECLFEIGPPKEPGEEIQKYTETAPCVPSAAGIGTGTSPVAVAAALSGLHPGTTYHYRLKAVNANGQILGKDLSVLTSGPVIQATWSEDVVRTEAILKAEINPKGSATTYHFEWGTSEAYGEETPELNVGSDSSVHEVTQLLDELEPGTTYHYRVIATNGVAVNEGPDRTFTTFEPFVAETDCPNQEFRIGASASLPDCRAYEMVSPENKAGADIVTRVQVTGFDTSADQAATSGDKMAYASYKPFGDAVGSYQSNQFIATRGAAGWSSHGISPPHKGTVNKFVVDVGIFPPRFAAFTDDLSHGWLYDDATPPLSPDAIDDGEHYNLYVRNNTNDTYEAVTTELFASVNKFLNSAGLGGVTGNGSHWVFTAGRGLNSEAATGFERNVYDYSGGVLRLASILPGGQPTNAQAGGLSSFSPALETANLDRVVSEDGSRIFWTTDNFGGPDDIYARIDGITTVPVSVTSTAGLNGDANYATASTDGSKVLFTFDVDDNGSAGNDLVKFDIDTETPTTIAHEVLSVLEGSDDLSRVYFVSKEALTGGAVAGEANLYLDQEGTKTLIATLPVSLEGFGSLFPLGRRHRTSSDGRFLAFQSSRNLTGYDNTSANNGEAAVEVYVYDAVEDELNCVSCNPSGARPLSEQPIDPYTAGNESFAFWAAAWIPTSRRGTHITRALSEDGTRLFFNAFDALVPQDTNGAQDVYQWEAQGAGNCTEDDVTFSEIAGGCVSLISTGTSPDRSEFIDASADGNDVFIRTNASIDPGDSGLIDIYDARVNGGFPPPPPPPPPCVGDACQNVPAPPNDPTPSSASFRGAGDPVAVAQRNCSAAAKRAAKLNRQAKKARAKGQSERATQLAKRAKQLSRSAARCRRANRRAAR